MEIKKLIKKIRERRKLKPGLIFVPYLIAESIPVIISGTFSPKSLLKSRYATKMINNKFYSNKKINKI